MREYDLNGKDRPFILEPYRSARRIAGGYRKEERVATSALTGWRIFLTLSVFLGGISSRRSSGGRFAAGVFPIVGFGWGPPVGFSRAIFPGAIGALLGWLRLAGVSFLFLTVASRANVFVWRYAPPPHLPHERGLGK